MKPKAVIVNCWNADKEGRHDPYSDGCLFCAPYWGKIPTCPNCKIKDKWNPERPKLVKLSEKGHCVQCKKYYDISEVKQ
jgi:hypothetical protein